LVARGLLVTSVLWLIAGSVAAIEIVPATMQDIVNALGPDAKGLRLPQESLPDLFTLTASRIEENANKFIVEERYASGRWKGGKAVIEYARDLSYTLVSIYDKEGHRQRIYSVSTSFSSHISQAQASPERRVEPPTDNSSPQPAAATGMGGRRSSPPMQTAKNDDKKINFEWNDNKGAYVPVEESGAVPPMDEVPASAPASASVQKQAPPPASTRHKRRRPSQESTVAAERPAAKVKVGNTTWVEKSPDVTPESTPPPERRHRHEAPATVPEPPVVVASVPSQKSAEATSSKDQWIPKSIREPARIAALPSADDRINTVKRLEESEVPSTEELINGPEAKTEKAPPVAAHPRAVSAEVRYKAPTPAPTPTPPPTPAPPPAPAKYAPPVAVSVPTENSVPSTEELMADKPGVTGPDTSASDSWTPKPVPKPVVTEQAESERQEPVKVAMLPKQAPMDNSVENLLKISDQSKSMMPHESEAWVPKKAPPVVHSEVDLNKELTRIQQQEKMKAATKEAPRIKSDVNNPEEGVLPVSSFEKFSGPMYGRHREYERRFVAGKQKSAKVPEHDFYVDEVDRKKEIHNVYFYVHQKGKAPKLVAVERHDQVTFLGNYDIEKENKGKISTY
jgi:hypothetical protein